MKTLRDNKSWRAIPAAIVVAAVIIGQPAFAASQAGTTLSVTKTATGFWERLIEYDWTITKEVDPAGVTLGAGESVTVNYKITTTKTPKAPQDTYGARGQICVTNGGAVATENLTVIDNVQAKVGSGQFTTISFNNVDVSAKPVLAPGESYCYPYRVTFAPIANAAYRNEAKVTITNHAGWLPGGTNCPGPDLCPFGPQYRVGFSLPATYTTIYRDASASISDTFTLLDNFSVSVSDAGPWTQTDAGAINFSATITNNGALCDSAYTLTNTASLTESDTQQQRSDPESLGITTKPCSSGDAFSGCTYTQGYWKNHYDSAWPTDVLITGMNLGNVNYTATELEAILMQPVKGNGLISLAHQLIAAKLNSLKASDPAAGGSLFGSIAAADALIGNLVVPPTNSSTDFLDPSVTSSLNNALTLFNQGGPTAPGNGDYDCDTTLDGPPHCGTDLVQCTP